MRIRVVAVEDGTELSGLVTTTLNTGEHIDVDVPAGGSLVATQPIAVVRTSRRATANGRTAAVAVSATSQRTTRHVVPSLPSSSAVR